MDLKTMSYYLHHNRPIPGSHPCPSKLQLKSKILASWHFWTLWLIFISREVTGTLVVTPNIARLEACQPRNHESQQWFWTQIFWLTTENTRHFIPCRKLLRRPGCTEQLSSWLHSAASAKSVPRVRQITGRRETEHTEINSTNDILSHADADF